MLIEFTSSIELQSEYNKKYIFKIFNFSSISIFFELIKFFSLFNLFNNDNNNFGVLNLLSTKKNSIK